jgi:hypothetical protein
MRASMMTQNTDLIKINYKRDRYYKKSSLHSSYLGDIDNEIVLK